MKISASDTNRDLEYSRPFDVHTWSNFPQVNMFVDYIYLHYFVANGLEEKNTGKHNLKKVLIELYVNWLEDPEKCIAFHRSNNKYSTNTRYNRLNISKKVPKLITQLGDLGLVDWTVGYYQQEGKSRISRMWPTLELVDHFKKADLNKFSFTDGCHSAFDNENSPSYAKAVLPEYRPVEDRECIIFKQRNPDRKAKEKQLPIEYKDNKNTRRMREELMAYNRLLVRTHIGLAFLEGPYLRIENEKRIEENKRLEARGDSQRWHLNKLETRIPISQHHKFTTRQFANSSWKQGGRFYGGWWQKIPAEFRSQIMINSTPTTEIDYSAHHPVLLYAQKGINYWKDMGGDLYELPGEYLLDRRPRVNDGSFNRDLLKFLLLMIINAKSPESAFSAFRTRVLDLYPERFSNVATRSVDLWPVLQAFQEKHKPIANNFCSGFGIKLQYIASEITAKILKHFTDRHMVVLPIHDSYVVEDRYGAELRLVMEDLWREQIVKMGAMTTAFDKVFQQDFDLSPKLKQIGNYDEPFDPEKEGSGEAHQKMIWLKLNTKMSERFRDEYMEFNAMCAEQGWPHSKGAYNAHTGVKNKK